MSNETLSDGQSPEELAAKNLSTQVGAVKASLADFVEEGDQAGIADAMTWKLASGLVTRIVGEESGKPKFSKEVILNAIRKGLSPDYHRFDGREVQPSDAISSFVQEKASECADAVGGNPDRARQTADGFALKLTSRMVDQIIPDQPGQAMLSQEQALQSIREGLQTAPLT